MIEIVSAVEPKCIGTFEDWTRVNIDVLDNNSIAIDSSKAGLLSVGPGGLLGGKPIDKNHPYQDWVKGELWVIANVDNTVTNLTVFPSGHPRFAA